MLYREYVSVSLVVQNCTSGTRAIRSTQPTRLIQTHGATCKHNIPFVFYYYPESAQKHVDNRKSLEEIFKIQEFLEEQHSYRKRVIFFFKNKISSFNHLSKSELECSLLMTANFKERNHEAVMPSLIPSLISSCSKCRHFLS